MVSQTQNSGEPLFLTVLNQQFSTGSFHGLLRALKTLLRNGTYKFKTIFIITKGYCLFHWMEICTSGTQVKVGKFAKASA